MGIEPMIKVLQTSALPLGYVALKNTKLMVSGCCVSAFCHQPLKGFLRAGDGIRTRDLLLGKETFYH